MRSSRALAASMLAIALSASCALAQTTQTATGRPSRSEVQAAGDALRADPDFGSTHKEKVWRLKREPAEASPPVDLGWLERAMRWISNASRVAVWIAGAALIGLLLVGLRHWIKVRADAGPRRSAVLPSHVHELDIRPESLPDRVGAAARELWLAGEHRAALSMLYRGALSRLVHDYAVPIRSASTEGECVQLARSRLDVTRGTFFGELVAIWQLAIYGARLPESARALALCDAFDERLGRAPSA